MEKKREWIDYVDLIVKILCGGILVAVLAILNTANGLKQEEIGNSLKFGEFTKSLMNDLLNTDSARLKSDVALITLNRTIGDNNPKLIAELGSRIIENFYYDKNLKGVDFGTMNTLFAVVKERDTAIYSAITLFAQKYNTKANLKADTNKLSSPKDTIGVANKITERSWTKLTLLPSKGTVYMQVNTPEAKYDVLLDTLKTLGFNTPAVEVITYTFKNTIRYYYDTDLTAAQQVKKLAQSELKTSFNLSKRSTPNARKGLIEVWWNLPPTSANYKQ